MNMQTEKPSPDTIKKAIRYLNGLPSQRDKDKANQAKIELDAAIAAMERNSGTPKN